MKIFSPETIFMGFLKGFFSQEELYGGLQNEFIYEDNQKDGTLIIKMSEYFEEEVYEEVPSLVIQEGGFSEDIKVMDNRNWHEPVHGKQGHVATFVHPITIHCMTRFKKPSKILQSAVCQAIIAFRKALYGLGIDKISAIQGMPPQHIAPNNTSKPEMYDASLRFRCRMDNRWTLQETGDLEESIRVSVIAALEDVEFDEHGNITTPPGDWFEQFISIDQES